MPARLTKRFLFRILLSVVIIITSYFATTPLRVYGLKHAVFERNGPRYRAICALGVPRSTESTLLFTAIRKRDHEELDFLLQQGVDPNSTDFISAVNQAVITRDYRTVEILLYYGASPDLAGGNATIQWPLKDALEAKDMKMVDLLLRHGADPTIDPPFRVEELGQPRVGWDGDDGLLGDALRRFDYPTMKLLLSHYRHRTGQPRPYGGIDYILRQAVASHGQLAVQVLLDAGVDVNIPLTSAGWEKRGETALFSAIRAGNVSMVRYLLDHGAKVQVKSERGNTPLGLARSGYHPHGAEIERILREHSQ